MPGISSGTDNDADLYHSTASTKPLQVTFFRPGAVVVGTRPDSVADHVAHPPSPSTPLLPTTTALNLAMKHAPSSKYPSKVSLSNQALQTPASI